MKTAKHVRVLMLGWEYPPRFAGGLGKACQGLSQAMAKQGAKIFFVLPSFPERLTEKHLEVVGAQECLLEAGWELDFEIGKVKSSQSTTKTQTFEKDHGIHYAKSDAQLFPYGISPQGPASESIKVIMDMMREVHTPKMVRVRRVAARSNSHQKQSQASQQKNHSNSDIYGENLWTEIERFCFTVRHLADTHEVDIVHAHDWMTFPAAFEFQRMTGVPVYLHVHATEYDRSGDNINHEVFRIEREGFRKANHIFAVSRYTAGVIERLYGVPRKKISVVYNAPEETARQLITSEIARKPQVVFLGRLTFQKGPDHFLKAAAVVARASSDARFILCGTGDMLDKLRHQTYKLGLEEKVHFAGFVDPAGVDEILRTSRVLVMPSVSEPFGLVALEAIHCGIPVILSKQSGVREVLQRALQVDFWDHEKLADQILAALRLASLSKQLVDEGMDQLQQLSWEKSAQKVLQIYCKNLDSTFALSIGGTHGH